MALPVRPTPRSGASSGSASDQKKVLDAIAARQAQIKAERDVAEHSTGLENVGKNFAMIEEAKQLDALSEALQKTFPEAVKLAEAQKILALSATQYASPAQQQLAEAQAVLASATASAGSCSWRDPGSPRPGARSRPHARRGRARRRRARA